MDEQQKIATIRQALNDFAADHGLTGAMWLEDADLPAPRLPQLTPEEDQELRRLKQAYKDAEA